MKQNQQIIICVALVFTCVAQSAKASNFNRSIKLNGINVNTIQVGLYYHQSYKRNRNGEWLGDPYYFTELSGKEFSLNATPGRYTMIAFAYGYQPVKKRIYFPDSKTNFAVDIELEPLAIDSNITDVKLVGEFCKWHENEALPLTLKDDIWILGGENPLEKDGKYQFVVNGVFKNDLSQKDGQIRKDKADFVNIYNEEKISFNPAHYTQTSRTSSAIITGYPLLEQYDQISAEIIKIKSDLSAEFNLLRDGSRVERLRAYNTIVATYENAQEKYDPIFHQLIIEIRLIN